MLKTIYNITTSSTPDERKPATGFAVIPYIQGVTEPIKRILKSHNVKAAQKAFQTLGHIFAKPKDPVTKKNNNNNEPTLLTLFHAVNVVTSTSDRPNVSLVHV